MYFVSGPKYCKRGLCGRGECVLSSVPPYYECRCKEPFQPPDCKTCECNKKSLKQFLSINNLPLRTYDITQNYICIYEYMTLMNHMNYCNN